MNWDGLVILIFIVVGEDSFQKSQFSHRWWINIYEFEESKREVFDMSRKIGLRLSLRDKGINAKFFFTIDGLKQMKEQRFAS